MGAFAPIFFTLISILSYKNRSLLPLRVSVVGVADRPSGSSERVYTEISVLSLVSIQVIVSTSIVTLYDVLQGVPSLYVPEMVLFVKLAVLS